MKLRCFKNFRSKSKGSTQSLFCFRYCCCVIFFMYPLYSYVHVHQLGHINKEYTGAVSLAVIMCSTCKFIRVLITFVADIKGVTRTRCLFRIP